MLPVWASAGMSSNNGRLEFNATRTTLGIDGAMGSENVVFIVVGTANNANIL
jgi:hypothetical protein